MHTQTMLIGSLPPREENFTVMQLFVLFCHISLQYKHMFDKIEQEKNWTESNYVCGFVGEIGAYHISYNCFQIRVFTVFCELFSKKFEDFISYLTTFDSYLFEVTIRHSLSRPFLRGYYKQGHELPYPRSQNQSLVELERENPLHTKFIFPSLSVPFLFQMHFKAEIQHSMDLVNRSLSSVQDH